MTSGTVQIVIKAPNQMTDDHTVECDRTWTAGELKEHLFKEYPTHPNPENQKLIYSGKLLNDSMLLCDVLKTYGGEEYNTIHLVCSVREGSTMNNKVLPTPVVQSTEILTPNSEAVNQTTFDNESTSNGGANEEDLLRRRPVNNGRNITVSHAATQYVHGEHDIAQQMLLIQQAYFQYMNMYIANGGRLFRLDNQPPEPLQNEQQNRAVQQNQVEPELDEEAGAQRDWLEWIYILTRVIVLFSIVYFYSSPLRFIVVMTMALLLFNMDVERWRRRQDEGGDPGHARNNDGGNTGRQPTENQIAEVQRPHPLNIISTFITTFFLSLIPEQRAL